VVNDLETTKEDSTDGPGLFKLSFEFRLDIIDDDGNVFDKADIIGDMTLEHQPDGSYKISRYYERGLQELLNKYLIEENEEKVGEGSNMFRHSKQLHIAHDEEAIVMAIGIFLLGAIEYFPQLDSLFEKGLSLLLCSVAFVIYNLLLIRYANWNAFQA